MPRINTSLKAVFFDAAGTLIHLAEPVGKSYAKIAAHYGANLSEEVIQESFLKAWEKAPCRSPVFQAREDDDKTWWRELVFSMLADLKVTLDQENFFEEAYRYFAKPESWKPFPETVSVLENLQQQGLRLGIISNFDSRLFHILDNWNLSHRMERIIVSSRVGMEKPDPKIFNHAAQMMGLSAEQILHVGDHPEEDYAGAQAAGFQALLIRRPDSDLRQVFDFL